MSAHQYLYTSFSFLYSCKSGLQRSVQSDNSGSEMSTPISDCENKNDLDEIHSS